jgi:hypothetical protein
MDARPGGEGVTSKLLKDRTRRALKRRWRRAAFARIELSGRAASRSPCAPARHTETTNAATSSHAQKLRTISTMA